MKIINAPVLLKKVASMCKSKSGVLAARLLVLASFRRRMATAGVISHKIHALMVAADRVMVRVDSFHKALMLRKAEKTSAIYGCGTLDDLSHQFTKFDHQEENDDGGCPNWTLHPISNDDDNCSYIEEYEEDDDELPAMDVIWSNQDVEGSEFNMDDDDIDQAAEVFIRRFREQMNKSL